jgi:hypothetical protein
MNVTLKLEVIILSRIKLVNCVGAKMLKDLARTLAPFMIAKVQRSCIRLEEQAL